MPEEEARSKRDSILAAASALFVQKGYEETTIAEIAQAAEVAVGTVYLYFRNKHEIYAHVSLDIGTKLSAAFSDPAIIGLPLAEIPQTIVDTAFRVCRENKELMALYQIDMQSPEELEQYKKAKGQVADALNQFLQDTIAQGQLAPFHTEMYAQLIIILGSAVLHQSFVIENGEREEMYRKYTAEFIKRLFFGPSLSL